MKVIEIEKEALRLSSKERAALSYRLLESIDSENIDDIDEIWQKEVEKRYAQLKTDISISKSADLVIKEAKSKYE
jgi:hypothetical protein